MHGKGSCFVDIAGGVIAVGVINHYFITCAACRFLCKDTSERKVPVTSDCERIPRIHKMDHAAACLGVPAGYCGDHPHVDRDNLPPHQLDLLRVGEPVPDEIDWKHKGELMYTAYEMHARAKHMQEWYAKQKAKIVPPLHELPVTKRQEQWDKLVNAHQRETKRVGVRGMSICSQLSYFRFAAKLRFAIQPQLLDWCCRHAVGGRCGQLAQHTLHVACLQVLNLLGPLEPRATA